MGRDKDDFSVADEITEVKVQIARIDERLKNIGEKQDAIQTSVAAILSKMGGHAKAIEKYKNDRKWITGIFGALYAALLAWIEYRFK